MGSTSEDTLAEMFAERMKLPKEEIKSRYFDNDDHWLTAAEAMECGLIDGVYDADPVPAESTPQQIYSIFNNRLEKPQNITQMDLIELKKRPRFQGCATNDDVLNALEQLESDAAKVPGLEAKVREFEAKAEADAEAARKSLLDAAELDGRIDATTRPTFENILKRDMAEGKVALEALAPKRRAMNDIHHGSDSKGAWERRMEQIRQNLGK